jgi:hypothetical protein
LFIGYQLITRNININLRKIHVYLKLIEIDITTPLSQ